MHTARPYAFLSAMWGSACAPQAATFDTELVVPSSAALDAMAPLPAPYLARYSKNSQSLTYVAARHENNTDSPTFRLIDRAMVTSGVRCLVVEGYQRERGLNPQSYLDYAKRTCSASFCEGGESAYAALVAEKKGIVVAGGEPPEVDVANDILNHGFAFDDLLGFYFVRRVPQLRRNGTLGKDGVVLSYEQSLKDIASKIGRQEDVHKFDFDHFASWYQRTNGKAFDAEQVGSEESAPRANGKFLTQRISAVVGLIRDRVAIGLLQERLGTCGSVVVVNGASHLSTQRPALDAALGPPAVEGPND